MMKKTINRTLAVVLSFVIIFAGLSSCDKDDSTDGPDVPEINSEVGIGTYLWADNVYDMGADGAKILAEMYSKTNIKTVYLLIKGSLGTVAFSADPNDEYIRSYADRDVLQEVISAMHAKNIQVYAWLYCNEDDYFGEFHLDEVCWHFRRGTDNWLPDVNSKVFHEYLSRMIQTVRENYQVDGFMFDHLRYNGAYYGWGERDFIAMTTDPKIGMTLDEYNEAVRLMAATYGYPIAKNSEGRYVYDEENPEIEEENPNALYDAANQGNVAVAKMMKYRELSVDNMCSAVISACGNLPVVYTSMPEMVTSPVYGTINYGCTINDTYLFNYVSPMLYSLDYGEDAEWVKTGCRFLHDHKYDCVPSLQAYRPSSTATLADDIAAAKSEGCKRYILFRSFTYDIAKVATPNKNSISIVYFKATDSSVGSVKINISDASKIKTVTLGGAFAGKQYTLDGNILTISGENFQNVGDEGVVSFELADKVSISSVESDRIVWLDVD